MAPELPDYANDAFSYVYEIEKCVEIHLMKGRIYRLEIVRCAKGTADAHYAVRYYERHTRYIAPDGSISTETVPLSTPYYIWVSDHAMPWVNQHSVEAALSQALEWLSEQRNN
jgi:hypothetical protein